MGEQTGKLKVSFTPFDENENTPEPIEVITMGRAPIASKTIFAVIFKKTHLHIYINGVLDTVFEYPKHRNRMSDNNDPLFFLGHPSYLLSCKAVFALMKTEIFEIELSRDDIWTLSEGFTGLVEPGYITIGCDYCSMHKVVFLYFPGIHKQVKGALIVNIQMT